MKKFSAGIILFLVCSGFLLGNANLVLAQTPPSTGTNAAQATADYDYKLGTCSFSPFSDGGSFVSCLEWAFYGLILYPSGLFADLTGNLFDVFVAYSISSDSYTNANGQFINQGWGVIRDIANVMFIFILLYIAIRHILQMGSSNTKRLLTSLIIAALLINFSLFFSKVIIDAGNILARQFYSHIQVTNDDHANGDNVKTISQQLIGKVNPQELLSSELFSQQQALGQEPGKLSAGYAFFIMALAAFVNITIGIVFLSTFLLFIARVVGLWFMMIFSPIAFASLALPGGGSFLGQFGWNGWRDNILKLSFMAPIFLFFLFLLVMFLQIIMPGTPADTSTQTIMGILIPFIVIIVVLRQAKKIAADMAGEFGGALQGAFSKIAGTAFTMAGGAVVGVAAYSGRKVIGGAASRRLASGVDQDRVARYNLQAGVSDRAAKEAKTVEERKRHEAEAKQSRRLASWNASKVKASAYLKNKATFDGRRSSTLSRIGGGINSVANFASKDVLGGSAVKLSLGKPTDKTQAKDEKEIAKNRLATAQLYSKEDLPGNGNESLKDIMSAADKGMDHQNDVLEHIDKYIEEIDKSDHFTEKEKEQRIRSAKDWRNSAESAQTDEELKKSFSARTASETVTNDKGEKVEQKITYNAPTELVSEGTSQRKAYADQTDYSNSLRYFNPLNKYAKEKLVNDIRSNKKNDDPKEMLKKIAKDLGFVEKGESKSDEPEKPKDDDKK